MTPDKKKQLLAVLLTIVRLWPLLLLLLIGLIAYALWVLFHVARQPVKTEPVPLLMLPAPVTEQSILAAAFGLLQRKITEQVAMRYPDARWVWSMSNAFDQFAAGQPLTILLNGAGGYQRATVWVQNLQFAGLVYTTISAANPEQPAEEAPEQEEPPAEAKEVDYGLLSFEWVEANMQRLNALNNEAVAAGQDGFRISAEELPHGDSWPTLCAELVRNGFTAAEPMADGIHVKIRITE